jgi:hypothetical protein
MPTEEEDDRKNRSIPGMNQKVGAPPKGTAGAKLSDVIDTDDADVQRILESLRQQQGEWDHISGRQRDPQERREAQILYLEIKEHADQARARREAESQQARDRAIAEEKNRLEEERNRISEGEVAGRLALEQQRIEIEKARVVVDAIEKIGRDPAMREQFGPMLEALSQRLLTGTAIGVGEQEARKLKFISMAAKPPDGSSNGGGSR